MRVCECDVTPDGFEAVVMLSKGVTVAWVCGLGGANVSGVKSRRYRRS